MGETGSGDSGVWYFYGMALVAGIASAIEPGQNASLAKAAGHPLFAGFVCCGLGALVFAGLMLGSGRPWPSPAQMSQAPWWAWCGGILGTVVVLSQLYASQRIGAAPFLATLVTAGVVTSVLLDRFGLFGFETHPLGTGRLIGAGLMIVGVALVAAF